MTLQNFTFTTLEGERPTLELVSTRQHEGQWLVTGTMLVTLAGDRGFYDPAAGGGKGLSVKLPFVDAKDEKDAIAQASTALLTIADKLKNVAQTLLGQR